MDKQAPPRAFGVFKPIGHVVMSFPPHVDLQQVGRSVAQAGLASQEITIYSADEMKRQIAADLENAGILASIGQEANLVKAHRALAEEGYGWLVVKVADDEEARRVADIGRQAEAERAQHYGRFVIEELIVHADEPVQAPESPDLGLDAGTPSGEEKERVALRAEAKADAAGSRPGPGGNRRDDE